MKLRDLLYKHQQLQKQIDATMNGIKMFAEQGIIDATTDEMKKLKGLLKDIKKFEQIDIEIVGEHEILGKIFNI